MADFSKALLMASELKAGASARRVRAVHNIATACRKLVEEGSSVKPTSVAKKISTMGMVGGPAAQSIYNEVKLKALVAAFAEGASAGKASRDARASHSSDEEEILEALPSARHKSMFRDIIAERDRVSAQMRILDGWVTEFKKSGGMLDAVAPSSTSKIEHVSKDDAETVDGFFEVLFSYGFDLVDGEIVKAGKPTGSRKFVELLRARRLL